MDKKSIVLGLIIFVALAGGTILYRNSKTSKPVPTPTPSVSEKITNNFKYQIPDDVEKMELKDVSGGNGSGLVTRKYEGGRFTLVVLADLVEPPAGSFYSGWLCC